MKRIVSLYHVKNTVRKFYSSLLCPQTCLLCGNVSKAGLPLCSRCIQTEFKPYIGFADSEDFQDEETRRCRHCGKILISEHDYCTRCRPAEDDATDNTKKHISSCDRIFTLFPYIGLGQKLLPVWKNNNIRTFSTVFAPLIHSFLTGYPKLMNIPIVPVPPRPKKLREKGWDQIEDLVKDLLVYPQLTIYRCLKRQDGIPQKKLSKTDRAVNLQGKIKLVTKTVPDTLILLDDVMTTGATLEACAHVLKNAGCREVYGLCLFFD